MPGMRPALVEESVCADCAMTTPRTSVTRRAPSRTVSAMRWARRGSPGMRTSGAKSPGSAPMCGVAMEGNLARVRVTRRHRLVPMPNSGGGERQVAALCAEPQPVRGDVDGRQGHPGRQALDREPDPLQLAGASVQSADLPGAIADQ